MPKIIPMPFAHTTFCEDVRHEINGKMSLNGIFGDTMYLAVEPPLHLRPLYMVLKYYEPRDFCEEPVIFSASLQDSEKPIVQFELFPSGKRPNNKEHVSKRPDWQFLSIDTIISLPSIEVTKNDRITCYVDVGDQRIRASYLEIIFNPQHEMFQNLPAAN